jgi:uncharacterized membrane protein YqjE
MAESESSAGDFRHEGFFQSLRSWFAALKSAVHTRLELFVTELEEERERLKQALLLCLLVFFGVSLGFILLNVFLIAVFWQAGWIYAIGAMAALYLAIGVAAGLMLRNRILTRPRLFGASLAELAKECDRLRSSHE